MHGSDLLKALFVVSIWGFSFVATKFAVCECPPILAVGLRFFLTSLPALFLKRPSISRMHIALYATVMFVLQFSLLFVGMSLGLSSGVSSIVLQLQAFFTILLATAFLGEKISWIQGVGGVLACMGMLLIANRIQGESTLAGLCCVVVASFFWGSGNLIVKAMGKVSVPAVVAWGSLFAWPPLFALSFFLEGPEAMGRGLSEMSLLSLLGVLYVAFASTWVGVGLWNGLVSRYPLTLIAPFTLLVPLFGMFWSKIILDEPLQSWKIMGAGLILAGLCLNILGLRKKAKLVTEEA